MNTRVAVEACQSISVCLHTSSGPDIATAIVRKNHTKLDEVDTS